MQRVPISVASITGRVAVGYSLLACLAAALALALRDGVPWIHPRPWLAFDAPIGALASAACGVASALLVISLTRVCVARFPWAQRLHLDLRPLAHGLLPWQIMVIAGCSSLGEELLFRGLLQPWIGLLPSSVVFGVLHQVPGEARWVWVTWATAVGLMFGAIFEATGSLVGPIVAHALVNAVNLTFLRDHDPLAGEQG
jgi:membrane protease YdiL (CAAX protease family)